jgi:hypothetical protein
MVMIWRSSITTRRKEVYDEEESSLYDPAVCCFPGCGLHHQEGHHLLGHHNARKGETPLEFQYDAKVPATLKIEKPGYHSETEYLNKSWFINEHHKGNYHRYYEKVGDTQVRLWKVRTTRDLKEKKE